MIQIRFAQIILSMMQKETLYQIYFVKVVTVVHVCSRPINTQY